MKAFDSFSETLKRLDLLPVFGNPGSTELSTLKSIDNYILLPFDGLAVGMADGYSQFNRKPSIVNLHTILGLGNSMAYIYTAKMNRTPVIITAGQQDIRHMFMEPLLSGNLTEFVGKNVKFSYEVKTSSEIPTVLRRAKIEALTPPFGPVFISFPMNLMDEEVTPPDITDYSASLELANEDGVEYVSQLINSSKNPVLVFGWEVDLFGAHKEAVELAEKVGCAVFAEPLSHRSPFPSGHPQFLGDLQPGSTLINLKLLQNDLIIFIGGDITLYPYLPSPLLKDKKVVFIGLNINPKVGEFIIANVRLFMKELKNKVSRKGNVVRPVDYSLRSKIANDRNNMGPYYVFSSIAKYFKNFVIVDESVSYAYFTRTMLGYAPNSYFTASSGQLGWGAPAAAGISMKTKKVLAIIGEGSFLYATQILWTVKRYNLPVKFIVLKNGGYSILKSYSLSYYPGMEKKDFLNLDVSPEKVAESYGIESREAGKELKELEWLSEGEESKLVSISMDKTIPKLFL